VNATHVTIKMLVELIRSHVLRTHLVNDKVPYSFAAFRCSVLTHSVPIDLQFHGKDFVLGLSKEGDTHRSKYRAESDFPRVQVCVVIREFACVWKVH
jgi:hypothetical protein